MMKKYSKAELLEFSNVILKFARKKSGLKYIDEIRTTEYGCELIFPEPIRYIMGLRLNTTNAKVIEEIDDLLFANDNIIESHNHLMDLHRNDISKEDEKYINDLIDNLSDYLQNIMYRVIFHPNVCSTILYHEYFGGIKIERPDDDE